MKDWFLFEFSFKTKKYNYSILLSKTFSEFNFSIYRGEYMSFYSFGLLKIMKEKNDSE